MKMPHATATTTITATAITRRFLVLCVHNNEQQTGEVGGRGVRPPKSARCPGALVHYIKPSTEHRKMKRVNARTLHGTVSGLSAGPGQSLHYPCCPDAYEMQLQRPWSTMLRVCVCQGDCSALFCREVSNFDVFSHFPKIKNRIFAVPSKSEYTQLTSPRTPSSPFTTHTKSWRTCGKACRGT